MVNKFHGFFSLKKKASPVSGWFPKYYNLFCIWFLLRLKKVCNAKFFTFLVITVDLFSYFFFLKEFTLFFQKNI